MIKKIFDPIKNIINNIDKNNLKIITNALKICFLILVCSIALLLIYLFFVHSNLIFQIGILVFQLSLYFAVEVIISGIAVDSIKKQIM